MNKQKVALILSLAMTTSVIGDNLLLSDNCEQRLVGEIEQKVKLKLDTEKPFDKLLKDAQNNKRLMEEKERARIEQEKKQKEDEERKSVLSRGDSGVEMQEINIICSAYTADPKENGNSSGLTASGVRLQEGVCAIPRNYKLGTKIIVLGLEKYTGFNKLTGYDYGNPRYIRQIDNNTIKIDVFMNSKREAMKFGVKKFKGYILKE